MADFCEVTDLEEILQVDIADDPIKNSSALKSIHDVSEAIKSYCKQRIEYIASDEIELDGNGYKWILLPELPVHDVISVIENGVTLIKNVDYKCGNHGILYKTSGVWLKGPKTLVVTYEHGYENIPEDISIVCSRAASRLYQASLSSADNDGIPGIASKQLGDFSVSYGSPGSGTDGANVGVSGSRLLLMSEKDILDRYKIEEI
jgi:hypothetical protein